MNQIKKLFSLQYEHELIKGMLQATTSGSIASNIIAPFIVLIVLFKHVPEYYLLLWVVVNFILFLSRLSVNAKLTEALEEKNSKVDRYLKQSLFISASTAFIFGLVSWLSILYEVPDVNIFIIGTTIVALTAGSIATLGTVFIAFVSFMLLSITPLILALLYKGSFTFNLFALILFVYLIVHLLSGYRLFLSHKRSLELEKKFRTIFNKSSDGIVIIKNGRFVECNETILHMFGYENQIDNFLTMNLYHHMPKKQPDGSLSIRKMMKMLRTTIKDGVSTFEWLYTKKDGKEFWVEVTLSTITLNNENVVHGIWRDIDDRKRIEEEILDLNATLESKVAYEVEKNRQQDQQLIQQSRLAQMGEMINMIAHQWRQPLSAISARTNAIIFQIMLDKEIQKESLKEELTFINDYSQHLSKTIDDFRCFFKKDKNREVTSFKQLVFETLDIIKLSLDSKKIKVTMECNSNLEFNTYANELKQVIINLIKNAEDALIQNNIQNPTITIITNNNSLSIKDNAGGINPEIIDKIFDPYFSTKLDDDGTGLGLYMSKTIVEKHCRGKLRIITSKDGSEFIVSLPIYKSKS